MNEKIKICGGKVFVYDEDEKCFKETTDPNLIGLVILDIAEKRMCIKRNRFIWQSL